MADTIVSIAALRSAAGTILLGLGARSEAADRVASGLVAANACGHHSHGVRQLEYYAGQIRSGEIRLDSDPKIVEDAGHFTVIDGQNGFGHVVADEAARLAVERARQHRLAAVVVRNANHIGRVGEYTEFVAREGLIGLILVSFQGSGQQLAPFGGADRRLTNNPISLAVPGIATEPVVVDMALSVVAESRILHAAERGAGVPEGWILDRAGNSTTDPDDYVAGGTLVPLGGSESGYKGYALIVAVELVVALLAGVRPCGPEEPPFSNAFVLICVDPGEVDGRADDVEAFVEWIKSSRLRPGASEILLPGELEARRRAAAHRELSVDESTLALLHRLARSAAVEIDLPCGS